MVITDSDDKAVYEKTKQLIGGGAQFTAAIQNPKLWTTEGGAPNRFTASNACFTQNKRLRKSYEIGIRTVELDLSEMEGGQELRVYSERQRYSPKAAIGYP